MTFVKPRSGGAFRFQPAREEAGRAGKLALTLDICLQNHEARQKTPTSEVA